MSGSLRFFLIAGEPSGDNLGAALIEGLRALHPGELNLEGIGGPAMAAAGLHSLFPMDELSVIGAAEVLPRVRNLLRRIRKTADAVIAARPDALITIDSPDFCLRVAKRARAALPELEVIHYVAPSVWAWRPGRAKKMARHVDHVLALLPFEPPLMETAGMSCDFVGHPVASFSRPGAPEIAALRDELGVRPAQLLLVGLPGSRAGEVARLAPVFTSVIRQLRAVNPDLAVVIPAAAPVAELTVSLFPPDLSGWPKVLDPRRHEATVAEGRKRAVMAAADVALAASGTVSLELAAMGAPMVIAYSMNWLSSKLAPLFIKLDTVTLVNIVTETRVVPEFLLDDCKAESITPAVASLLTDAGEAALQREAGDRAMVLLGREGDPPGLRAARSVLAAIGR